jgi:hypothetical protein
MNFKDLKIKYMQGRYTKKEGIKPSYIEFEGDFVVQVQRK